jgi:hypothetical protein
MRIAVAVFEGAEELDFAGPWEVPAAWHFLYPVAATLATLASGAGDSYGRPIGEILRSFEMRERFLEISLSQTR